MEIGSASGMSQRMCRDVSTSRSIISRLPGPMPADVRAEVRDGRFRMLAADTESLYLEIQR